MLVGLLFYNLMFSFLETASTTFFVKSEKYQQVANN